MCGAHGTAMRWVLLKGLDFEILLVKFQSCGLIVVNTFGGKLV